MTAVQDVLLQNFEELFVRVVPVEVCCIHSSSNGGSSSVNVTMKNTHCLRMNPPNASCDRFPDTPHTPGTPGVHQGMNAAGLYPTLSSPEVQTCFCPNCCSNTNTNSFNANDPFNTGALASASETLQPSPSSADAGALAGVAIQRITVRVLAQKARYGANGRLLPGSFRLELSSDHSLFFLFQCVVTDGVFQDIKEACDLSLSFQQLPGLLLQLLDLLVRQPSTYLARLMMQQDGTAALEFAQTLGFKTISLLVLPRLEPAPNSMLRAYVTARHTAVLDRCTQVEAELAELKALVRQRCPNLLVQASNKGHLQQHSTSSINGRQDLMA